MAKNAKSKPAVVKPASHAVTFAAVVLATQGALVTFAKSKIAAAVEGATRSASAVSAVCTMRDAAKDAAEFSTAIVGMLGNRDKTKAGRIVGTLRPILEAEKIDDGTIRTLLKEMRTFADHVDNAEIRAVGEKSGMQAAYNAVQAAKKKETEAAAPTGETSKPAPKLLTFEEVLAQRLEENADAVLARIESYYSAKKDPIRGDVIHQARAKLA
jgi:hypothetical protein